MPDEIQTDTETGLPVSYLDCPPWDGRESTLPRGGQIRDPTLSIQDFFLNWDEARFAFQLKVDEVLYNDYIEVMGADALVIAESVGTDELTREDWKTKYGTDGLKCWAIKEKFYKSTGGGVQSHPLETLDDTDFVKIGGKDGITRPTR